jgi:hypothetical protein
MNIHELFLTLIQNYTGEILISIFSILSTWLMWLRGFKPKILFSFSIVLVDKFFGTQIRELISISEFTILNRIKNETYSNRVSLVDFKRNGYTIIEVLSSVKNKELKPLRQLNNKAAHRYRDLIDDLGVENGAMVFDKNSQKNIDFYYLISTVYGADTFVLVPVYQNDTRKHIICVLIGFSGHKTFDKRMLDYVIIQASKVAKSAYLGSQF